MFYLNKARKSTHNLSDLNIFYIQCLIVHLPLNGELQQVLDVCCHCGQGQVISLCSDLGHNERFGDIWNKVRLNTSYKDTIKDCMTMCTMKRSHWHCLVSKQTPWKQHTLLARSVQWLILCRGTQVHEGSLASLGPVHFILHTAIYNPKLSLQQQ